MSQPTELVFAICSVDGATVACAAHGDAEMVRVLAQSYALAADSVRAADGRVLKVMGDGMVVVFPSSKIHEAIDSVRELQAAETALWGRFDARCSMRIKAGVGVVMTGAFGPPGNAHDDIYGDALNRLFKMPFAEDVTLSPDLHRRSERR